MEIRAAQLLPGDVVVLTAGHATVAAVTADSGPDVNGRVVHVAMPDGAAHTWKTGAWITVATRGGVDVTHIRGTDQVMTAECPPAPARWMAAHQP